MPAAVAVAACVVAPAGAEAAFPGPSGRIYFTAPTGPAPGSDVWSIEPDGSGLVNLTDLPGGPGEGHDPSVAPDGTVAFVVGAGTDGEIWAMGGDGSAPRRLTHDSYADRTPAFSPDGARIAYASDRGEATAADLWTIAADGSDARPLLTAPGDDLWPQYSADGAYVVLATSAAGNFDIAYVTAAGGPHAAATPITTRSALDETEPAMRPDMVRLAYTQSDPAVPGSGDLQTAYSNDGTDEYPLAVDPARAEYSAAYSPDGSDIVYVADGGLTIAASGGAGPAPLSTGAATSPADPDWAVGPHADRTPPNTTITRRPRTPTANAAVRFRFVSSEPGSSFTCRLDARDPRPCGSPARYRHLRPGRHRFRVTATDAAGNADRSPARARFRVLASG